MFKLASKMILRPGFASFSTLNKAVLSPAKHAWKPSKYIKANAKLSGKKRTGAQKIADIGTRRHNLFLKLTANPLTIDPALAEAYFKLFSANSHANPNLTKMLSASPELLYAYIDYFYGKKMMPKDPKPNLRILEIAFDLITVMPAEKVAKGIEMIFEYLQHHNLRCIQPSVINHFYFRLIMIAKDMESAVKVLDALKLSEPVLTPESEEIRQYFTKWAYLSTLDQLESALQKPATTVLVNHAILTKTDKSGGDLKNEEFSAVFNGRTNDWTGNTFVRLKNGNTEFNATLIHHNDLEDYSLVVPTTTKVDCSLPYTIYNVDFLGTFKASLDALALFAKQGKSNPVYDYLMGNKTPPEFEIGDSLVRLKKYWGRKAELNDSQYEAIDGVMQSPLSLIQGPPGTGKTHTLAMLVKTLVRMRKKVLVVAPTNSAADNIMQFALDNGLNPIRTGDYDGTREDMRPYLLQTLVPKPLVNFIDSLRTLRSADLICTTTGSAGNSLFERLNLEYLIMDEASQVTEPVALIGINVKPKHVILVGDHKQLPPSINHVSSLAGFGVSLFARLAQIVNPFLLTTQYRSHPLIMSISSDLFYEGRLENGVSAIDRPPLPGFPWKRCENNQVLPVAFVPCESCESASNTSKSNSTEASMVLNLVRNFIDSGVPAKDIGVISAYAGQNVLLKKMFAANGINGLEINSVDAYQGREKELIIFSATRSNSYGQVGFLSDPRRFNVMHTRARRGLVVVGNRRTLSSDTTWKKWFEWIDRHRLTVNL